MRRAAIYIDGQNLHYRLDDLGLQEKDVNWGMILGEVVPPDEHLIRAYWYQAARIASWEWYPKLANRRPATLTAADFEAAAKQYYQSERDRLDYIHRVVYGRIEETYDSIEFRYSGALKVDPTAVWTDPSGVNRIGKRVGEKGVDVAMAVDMVRHTPKLEHVIAISGDFDLTPALQAVKDMLRRVTVVSFKQGTPPNDRSQARRLRGLCDREVEIYEADLKGKFKA